MTKVILLCVNDNPMNHLDSLCLKEWILIYQEGPVELYLFYQTSVFCLVLEITYILNIINKA